MKKQQKQTTSFLKDPTDNTQEIWTKFVKPYVKYFATRVKQPDVKQLIEQFFCIGTRMIVLARAKKKFKMPGALRYPPNHPVRGLKKPIVEYLDILYIGLDSKDESIVIELPDETEYNLTKAEYKLIEPFLEIK